MSSLPPDDDDRTVIRPSGSTAPPPRGEAVTTTRPGAAAATAASSAGSSGVALPVGTYLGEFELTSVLGEGGFGIVYLAWDHSLERKVALKEYMPSALAMRTGATEVQVKSERHRETFEAGRKSFVNEARLLAQFDHPSLVKVYRFWEANGTAYMVMPFYEGITLKDKLKELGTPPDEAWLMGLLAPLTEALAVIHTENCFHRDIAPDNVILLAGTGKPLLLDFGAARRVIGDMTQALTVILKPGYAPVEQYAEAPGMKQGPWTDVYALAASVYFAILGKTPPPSVSRLMGDSYVPLVESCAGRYSHEFLAAVDNALRVRPEERTQSIEAFRADLGLGVHAVPSHETRLIATDPLARAGRSAPAPAPAADRTRMPSPAAAQQPAAPPKRTALWAGLGGAGVLAVGIGLYFALSSSSPPPSPKPAAEPAATAAAPAPALAPAVAVAPPAASPAPPPVQAAPASFDASAEFDRVLAGQTPGFDVQAAAARPQLRVDKDELGFTVRSARDGFVTVLVLGPDGSLMRLVPSSEIANPRIRAGQPLRLPPPEVHIGTSEPTGAEHFLVMVSSKPRDFGALSTRVDGGYLMLPTGAEAQQAIARLPRDAPALLGEAKGCTGADCNQYGAARFTIEVVR